MAVVLGTNAGFVAVAPTDDPLGGEASLDNYARALKDTSPSTAVKITEIGWYCDNATEESNFDVAIYTHSSGTDRPNAVVSSISADNAKGTDAGWKKVTGLEIPIDSSTIYWIGISLDDTTTTTSTNYVSSGGTKYVVNIPGPLTDPFGTPEAEQDGGLLSFYAVYKNSYSQECTETLTLSDTKEATNGVKTGINCGFVAVAPTGDPKGPNSVALADYSIAFKDTSPAGSNKITEVGWYCSGATSETNFEVGLYTHDSGTDYPDELIEVSRINAKGTTEGWKTVTVDWEIPTGETVYWLAVQADGTAGIDADYAGVGRGVIDENPGTLESPWGIYAGDSSRTYAVYAVYEAGSQQFSETYTETLSLADTYTTAWVLSREYSDTLTLSDSILSHLSRELTETINLSDNITYIIGFNKELTESLSLSDVYERTWELSQEFTETINLSDERVWELSREYSDTISLSDSYERVWTLSREYTESITLTEEFKGTFGITLTDSISLSDSYERTWISTKELTDTLNISDGDSYSLNKEIVETLNLTDIVIGGKAVQKELSDTLNLTDSYSDILSATKELTDSLNLSDAYSYYLSLILSDSLSLSDSYERTWLITKELIDTLTLSEIISFQRDISKELTETITLTAVGTTSYSLAQECVETLNLSDGDYYGQVVILSETLNLTDIGIILKDGGDILVSTNVVKPVLVSTKSGDYEL